MSENWILILKIVNGLSLGGAVTAICLAIRHIWIAHLQRDKDKLVELRQDVDGSKQFTVRGYSREDQAKIVKQLTQNSVADVPTARNVNGRASLPKILKS